MYLVPGGRRGPVGPLQQLGLLCLGVGLQLHHNDVFRQHLLGAAENQRTRSLLYTYTYIYIYIHIYMYIYIKTYIHAIPSHDTRPGVDRH